MKKITKKIARASAHEAAPERPYAVRGVTYKLKPPEHIFPHAIYLTINDVEMDGRLRPFEVFINSKDMANFQWVVAVTRLLSAIFRKGGDVAFVCEEMTSIFDPKGGWWEGGKYKHSLIAAIGEVLRGHLEEIGVAETPAPAAEALGETKTCPKCGGRVVEMDGCPVCVDCGDSKCG